MVRFLLALLLTAPVLGGHVAAGAGLRAVQQTGGTERLEPPPDPPSIIPLPHDYAHVDGVLRLLTLQRIVLGRETTEGDRFAAMLIQEELRGLDVDVTIDYEGPETSDSSSIVIRAEKGVPDDGYRLHVTPSGVLIEGSAERGRFYGAMSMLQLIRGAGLNVPALRIVDRPEVALRGVLDEISFQLPTLQEFKRIIRFLGEHKMNVYALPVEEIFRFTADRTAGMGSVSADELDELQHFAASYHVEIVPVFRTLGHFGRLLRLPEYAHLAEFPGAATPNTQDSAAYDLMETLLDEIIPVFRSNYVHIGGTLSNEVGIGASAGAVEAEGVAVVNLRHYRRIHDLVQSRGKLVMMDADLLVRADERMDERWSLVPPDVVLVDVQQAAYRFPAAGSYEEMYARDLDEVQSFDDARPPNDARQVWKSERSRIVGSPLRQPGRIFPNLKASRLNLLTTGSAVRGLDADGVIAIGWAAAGAPLLRAMQYREYAYAAEAAWNAHGGAGIDERFTRLFYGVAASEMRDVQSSLEHLTTGLTFPALWQHPLHRRDSGMAADSRVPVSLPRYRSERLLSAIEELQKRVARGGDRLDYDAFAVRFSRWLSDSSELASWMEDARIGERPLDFGFGASWARRLSGDARSLAQAFRSLWLRTNREIYLDRVIRMFRYQVAYFERMAAAMNDGRMDVQTTVPSRFIRAVDGAGVSHMRTTFSLERGQIADAYLQVTGENDVQVWLNGDRVGRIVGAERADVEVWNVASRLRSGSNLLAAKAVRRGYSTGDGSGTANIYLEIHFDDGRIRRIVSDQDWKAIGEAPANWLQDRFSDVDWPRAEADELAPTLTAPMFESALPSIIELGADSNPR